MNIHSTTIKRIVLLGILFLAFMLRGFNIGNNPPSVYGDEISFAWNAWSILHTGADEYGITMPLQFKAFNDYKSPIPVYLLVPIFKLFGMNAWSLRMPVVIVSVATVWMTYFFLLELCRLDRESKRRIDPEIVALIAAGLLAINPWHIHLSRGYFEATLALLPFIAGVYFFLKGLRRPLFLYAASISFAISLYTYFTPRIVLLLFLPFLFLYFKNQINLKRRTVWFAIGLFILLSIPLVKLALFDSGGHRMIWLVQDRLRQSAEIATHDLYTAQGPFVVRKVLHNRYGVFIGRVVNDYLEHFSLNFWYLYGDNSLRYFLGNMGMFHVFELPFFIIGLWHILRYRARMAGLLFGWLAITPIPTALVGRSFAVRSIAMLPIPHIIAAFGVATVLTTFHNKKTFRALSGISIMFGFVISTGWYVARYHFDYPRYGATWWGWENKAALDLAKEQESRYETIFISDFYTGAPLAYAFYNQLDPRLYRAALANPIKVADDRTVIKIGKYYFGSLDLDTKRVAQGVIPPKTLYIGRPEEADGSDVIRAPDDGRVLFKIHHTQ